MNLAFKSAEYARIFGLVSHTAPLTAASRKGASSWIRPYNTVASHSPIDSIVNTTYNQMTSDDIPSTPGDKKFGCIDSQEEIKAVHFPSDTKKDFTQKSIV